MTIASIFSGVFCNNEAVVKHIVDTTDCRLITDDMLIARASELSGIGRDKIKKAFSSNTSVFNRFTHEKERSIAYLKLSLAQALEKGQMILPGFCGQLIPSDVDHVLRVCLIANTEFRLALAKKHSHLPEADAAQIIRVQDHDRAIWIEQLFSAPDPWEPSLYDIVLPMDKTDPVGAANLIIEGLSRDAVRRTSHSAAAAEAFFLSATTEVALLNAGHNVTVEANGGLITLTTNKKVLMLERLEDELRRIAGAIPGVKEVRIRVNPPNDTASLYRKQNFEVPSKVLLVDDEREFVQTLSERLQMRNMGSAVAFDGASALDLVQSDEPDVMILDLKMPGIDGMEVLERVKKTQPEIEVIVLTGHGSEQDRKKCMDLGAFAYMQKPVDINQLSETLKRAHEKACISR